MLNDSVGERGYGCGVTCFFYAFEIFWIILSIYVHAICHWFFAKRLLDNKMLITLGWVAFASKNSVLIFLRFSCGMGFMIMIIWKGGLRVALLALLRCLVVFFSMIVSGWSFDFVLGV